MCLCLFSNELLFQSRFSEIQKIFEGLLILFMERCIVSEKLIIKEICSMQMAIRKIAGVLLAAVFICSMCFTTVFADELRAGTVAGLA